MEDAVLFTVCAAIIAVILASSWLKFRRSCLSDSELREEIRREYALRNSRAVIPIIVYPEDIDERRRELASSGRRRLGVSAALLIALAIVSLLP